MKGGLSVGDVFEGYPARRPPDVDEGPGHVLNRKGTAASPQAKRAAHLFKVYRASSRSKVERARELCRVDGTAGRFSRHVQVRRETDLKADRRALSEPPSPVRYVRREALTKDMQAAVGVVG